MRTFTVIVLAATLLNSRATDAGTADDHFEVHEWGTFTSMQSASVFQLDGLHHEEETLPRFVHDLDRGPTPEVTQGKGFDAVRRVSQKMETPVIYFHSSTPRRVRVAVQFQRGVISQWFPNATEHEMHFRNGNGAAQNAARGEVDMKEVDRSTIRWDVDLTPADRPEPTGIPVVADDDPWAFARQVRAAYVKTDQGEAEKYLFYRGLGAFSMPIRIKERAPNRFVVRNEGHHAVEASFLLENHANGSRFVRLGELGGNQEQLVSFEHVDRRSTGDVVAQLSNAVKSELVAAGLFEDEALAMVRTWSRSWFAGEGTRLIYVVPRRLTEQLLPMSISPAPDKLVRVLVGRLEYLSLEVENEVNAAIRDRFHTDSARSRAASARLERLGRFLEPGLRNALESKDPIVRRNAGRLLENVR